MPGPMLIAEIGGSSSRWALLTSEGEDRIFPNGEGTVPGFNPLSGDERIFIDGLKDYFTDHDPEVFSAGILKAYGAGCGDGERRTRMHDALRELWPDAIIEVETDLMAAALGLCHDKQGLVLILGTGMNAGHFDGSRLHQPMPSLGYILGDEGSGADIGSILLQDAFYGRMPGPVKDIIFGPEGPDLAAIMAEVYGSPYPAKMLASRTVHLAPLIEVPYVRELILARFHVLAELLKSFFTPDERREVHATGSVAFGFREMLGECLLDHGMTLASVAKDPLPGLVQYERRQ
jgi:glucosamine kinase